jgi:protein-disulfide isomerase
MRILPGVALALILATLVPAAPPAIDKTKLEAYLRYAEGFLDNVHFKIGDPTPSPFPNFYQFAIHLTTDKGAKLDRTYFITPDGQQIINGSIWDLHHSPFEESLLKMPDSGYSFGPRDAKVHLVIFSDFECPYCREFAKTVRENIPKKYPADVRVTFQDFPLSAIHPWAQAAAEASHCVGDQSVDEFWAYHDWMFAHATEIKPDNLKQKILDWAKDQKLDSAKLQTCMDTHADAPVVAKSLEVAKELNVQQTPTSFINGRLIPGALPWASLESVIDLELKRPTIANSPVVSH